MSKKTVIKPDTSWKLVELKEIWEFRDLFLILTMRDVQLRYKQTILGVFWVILQPLAASVIFAIIFGYFAELPSGDTNYLLFVFAGILPWNLFAGSLQRAGNSLVTDARLISKVYFPRIIIPTASALAVLVDFAVSLVVMFVLMMIYGVSPTANLLFLTIIILLTLFISIGVSLFFSALNVYYRDFMYALPFIIQVWMYATPVVYAGSLIPEKWTLLYSINPMVGVVEGFRWVLLDTGSFPAEELVMSFAVSFILFVIGVLVFNRVERNFADVI